jgi:hypothetical protein
VACNGAEEFLRFSREMVREGVDNLMINVSGGAGTRPGGEIMGMVDRLGQVRPGVSRESAAGRWRSP